MWVACMLDEPNRTARGGSLFIKLLWVEVDWEQGEPNETADRRVRRSQRASHRGWTVTTAFIPHVDVWRRGVFQRRVEYQVDDE